MKKVTILALLLAFAASGSILSASSASPVARENVGASTVHVPPVAKPGPVAVPGKKK